jgi:hypothetical protein
MQQRNLFARLVQNSMKMAVDYHAARLVDVLTLESVAGTTHSRFTQSIIVERRA